MKFLAIVGSMRATSSSAALVRAAARLAPPGAVVEIYDGVAALPHFSPDLDVEPLPPAVVALRAALGACDGLVIATPEYGHGMPGSLKNALDWLVSATEPIDLPVLLISGSPGGAAHAHAQFSEVLRTMSMRLVDGGAHVFSRAKLDSDGNVADEAVLAALRTGLAGLAELAVHEREPDRKPIVLAPIGRDRPPTE
jgi:NAD(P)H-dependent FMN reductase